MFEGRPCVPAASSPSIAITCRSRSAAGASVVPRRASAVLRMAGRNASSPTLRSSEAMPLVDGTQASEAPPPEFFAGFAFEDGMGRRNQAASAWFRSSMAVAVCRAAVLGLRVWRFRRSRFRTIGRVRPHVGGSRSQCRQHGNHPLFFGGYVRGFPMSLAVTSHRAHPRFGNRFAVRSDCPEICPYITRCVSLFHRLSSAAMMETFDIATFPFLQGCFG